MFLEIIRGVYHMFKLDLRVQVPIESLTVTVV